MRLVGWNEDVAGARALKSMSNPTGRNARPERAFDGCRMRLGRRASQKHCAGIHVAGRQESQTDGCWKPVRASAVQTTVSATTIQMWREFNKLRRSSIVGSRAQ